MGTSSVRVIGAIAALLISPQSLKPYISISEGIRSQKGSGHGQNQQPRPNTSHPYVCYAPRDRVQMLHSQSQVFLRPLNTPPLGEWVLIRVMPPPVHQRPSDSGAHLCLTLCKPRPPVSGPRCRSAGLRVTSSLGVVV